MPSSIANHRLSRAVALVAGLAISSAAFAQPAAPAVQESIAKIRAAEKKFQELYPSLDLLGDPAAREKSAAQGIPILKEIVGTFDEIIAAKPALKPQVSNARNTYESLLYTLGDEPTKTRLQTAAAGTGEDAVAAKGQIIQGDWYLAGKDAAKQGKAVDAIESLAKENPGSAPVTVMAYRFSQATGGDLAKRLKGVVAGMKNSAADQINPMLARENKLASYENAPLVVTGKTVDGADFSTADWKGKVVIVDFWATWCGPCVAELPELKKFYAEHHDKGLEILGVSSDFDVNALKKFVAAESMTWPQIFDAPSAAKQEWHPLAMESGIKGLPTMFVIDKKGVVRSVEGVENYKQLVVKLLAES